MGSIVLGSLDQVELDPRGLIGSNSLRPSSPRLHRLRWPSSGPGAAATACRNLVGWNRRKAYILVTTC